MLLLTVVLLMLQVSSEHAAAAEALLLFSPLPVAELPVNVSLLRTTPLPSFPNAPPPLPLVAVLPVKSTP